MIPAFLKGQSHALPTKKKRKRGNQARNHYNAHSVMIGTGPRSVVNKEEAEADLEKIYADLSSSSDESVGGHLNKL